MTRNPLPRRTTTLTLTLELSAATEDELTQRLTGIEHYLAHRLARTTFQRLAGMPKLTNINHTGGSPA